jgi:hypothetical protein
MTNDEALDFLRVHQPLPSGRGKADDSLIARFDEVRKHFLAHPDPRCVPLLLGAMGDGYGHGVYQLVEDTLRAHPDEVVVASLLTTLEHPIAPVRCWSAHTAMCYPRPELVPALVRMLKRENPEEQLWAASALARVETDDVRRVLADALVWVTDNEVRSVINETLGIDTGR